MGSGQSGQHDCEAGEAIDDLIVHVVPPLAQVVIAGALGLLALIAMVLLSAIGFYGAGDGDGHDINGWAVFLAVVGGALTVAATFLFLNALIALWTGSTEAVAEANRRRSSRSERNRSAS